MVDIGNICFNAPCREKVYFIAETEFGLEKKGNKVIIARALYDLKSSGSAWNVLFAESLCRIDKGLWFKLCS